MKLTSNFAFTELADTLSNAVSGYPSFDSYSAVQDNLGSALKKANDVTDYFQFRQDNPHVISDLADKMRYGLEAPIRTGQRIYNAGRDAGSAVSYPFKVAGRALSDTGNFLGDAKEYIGNASREAGKIAGPYIEGPLSAGRKLIDARNQAELDNARGFADGVQALGTGIKERMNGIGDSISNLYNQPPIPDRPMVLPQFPGPRIDPTQLNALPKLGPYLPSDMNSVDTNQVLRDIGQTGVTGTGVGAVGKLSGMASKRYINSLPPKES